MTYRWVGACLAALACSGPADVQPLPEGGTASVSFDESGVLTLAPKQTVTIGITTKNASNVTLSLAGNYLDAFLGADAADAASGHTMVTLRAPSQPSTFSVLAVAAQTTARLDVAVSATGFATVRVTMDYQGKRPVPITAASAFLETTCAQLGGKAVDGAPLVVGTYGEKLVIPSVPTDGQVAINVRIAHYATGCLDIASLQPNDTHDVTISLYDLPLDLGGTTLETRFTFTPETADAASLLSYFSSVVGQAVTTAAFGTSESKTLLDAMATASSSPSQFASARTSGGWDAATQTWLSARPPTMTARSSSWMNEGVQAGLGDLTGHVAGDPTKPVFTPLMIGALDVTAAGVSAPLPFQWSGQANDVLSLSGVLDIVPSELACAIGDARAKVDVSGSTGAANALATVIDCAGLGSALAGSGYAFGTCNASCMASLCGTALTAMWSAGSKSLSKTSDTLTLSMSVAAPAQVGDTATVESYVGTWIGAFGYGSSKVSTEGAAKGAYGTIPN